VSAEAAETLRADLVAYLRRRGQAVEDAEDVVQDAFVRLYRAGHALHEPDARPLLFVIARNLLRDRWKTGGREAARRISEDIQTLDEGPRAVPDPNRNAEERLGQRQDLAAAATAIRALPRRTREAILLHRFEDMTYRQIAVRLGVSVSTVEKLIAEALRQLKKTRSE
jgi:RNA polymerase sigma factor (sigma-70 family)